jgi:hypothetical protein
MVFKHIPWMFACRPIEKIEQYVYTINASLREDNPPSRLCRPLSSQQSQTLCRNLNHPFFAKKAIWAQESEDLFSSTVIPGRH